MREMLTVRGKTLNRRSPTSQILQGQNHPDQGSIQTQEFGDILFEQEVPDLQPQT